MEIMLKEKLIENMKNYFEGDRERINHTLKVVDFAEKLIKIHNSDQIDREIVIYSAILHDIGIKKAEEKYDSSAGNYQEIEGPPVAGEILSLYDLNQDKIDEICEIIGHHHSPGNIETDNFKILYDADGLVNLPTSRNFSNIKEEEIKEIIEKFYLTETGKNYARKLFL